MRAASGMDDFAVGVSFEGLEVFGGAQDDGPTVATAAPVGASTRLVLLAVKRDAPVASATSTDEEAGFIYELQRG
jgi:hypothetical protein